MQTFSTITTLLLSSIVFLSCSNSGSTAEQSNKDFFKKSNSLNNNAAYVTSQCYTKTIDENKTIHNPCFSCHINSKEPNYIDDWDLQVNRDFSDYTKVNRFTNLFKDRTDLVANITDNSILNYVRENNYKQDNKLLLQEKLSTLPNEWDVNGDGVWNGYMPDCYFDFNDEGFDKNPKGDYTGWRAFAYYPFLGTFWPTNGSTDDVLIRLDEIFRQNNYEVEDIAIYKLNLSIVESLIKQADVPIERVDENIYGVDLNQDGLLNDTNIIKFNWTKPDYNATTGKIENFSMSYVGKAKELLKDNIVMIAPGLFPKNTEFLHSVRYLDIKEDNSSISMAPRMKELRYAKKTTWNTYGQLQNATMAEIMEKDLFPDRLRTIVGTSETGLQTGLGWVYQGFIEDKDGDLRPQNYEETQYCIGCHSGVGAIADSTFVYQRKFDNTHFQKGWYHWSQDENGLKNIKEPKTKDGRYEYSLYLEQNNAADEFRANTEAKTKFFQTDTVLKQEELEILHNDISHLLYPSISRALELNKAYKVIVDEQSFIYGRDAHVKPVENVYKEIDTDLETGVIQPIKY